MANNLYVQRKDEDVLIIAGGDLDFEGNAAEENGVKYIKAPLTHNNACKLREYFPFTAPKPVLSTSRTFGVGDRLGVACRSSKSIRNMMPFQFWRSNLSGS